MQKLKIFFLSLILIFAILTGVRAEFFSDVIVTSPNGIWTDSRSYTTLNDAVTAVGTVNQRTIVIASPQTVTALTVPSNITLKFERDGAIVNSGQLTINTKNIISDGHKIFAGLGDIDFAAGTVVKLSWFHNLWNALTMTSDDHVTMVIDKAINATASCAVGADVTLRWEAPNIITANAGVTVSNIGQIEAGSYQILAGAGNFRFRDGVSLNLEWFPYLRMALTWIDTTDATIVVNESSDVDYSDSVPLNIQLKINNGGALDIAPGVTLTIANNKQLDIGPCLFDPFTGTGSVAITGGTTYTPANTLTATALCTLGYEVDALMSYGDGTDYTDTTLMASCTAVGANVATILIRPGTWVQSANVDYIAVCPNAVFKFAPGAIISHGTNTLNIHNINAGDYQIFSGTGTITLSGNTTIVYPEWWGIDGTADDVEIEKALAAGKKVELTAATYSTTGVITIADTYDDRTLFSKVGSNITGSQDVMFETAADRTTVDGVIFTNSHATEQGGTTAFPIYSHDNSYFKFINSKVNGFGTYGVNLDHSHYAIIEYNYIDGGITSDPGGDTGHACIHSNASSGIRVQNNYLLKGAQQGVLLRGTGDAYQFNGDSSLIRGRHNYITNNYFVDCWDHPIYASAARYTTIANNTSYNCGSLVTTGTGYTITGNILRSSGNGGINIRNGQEVTCTGNIVEVTGVGVGLNLGFNNTGLQNMDNIVVKGNTFIGGYAGVYLAESDASTASYSITDVMIEGNQFLDNTTYGVTWYAADAAITDVSRISISNNQFQSADTTPPTAAIYARYMQNFKLDNNQINGSYDAGIMVRNALGNGSVCGNKMNLTAASMGLYFKTISDFVSVKNNVIDGTVTTMLTTAEATDYLYIKGESITSYFGTTGATDDLEVPIMSVHQPNGIVILGSYITDAANVAQSDTDYNTFTLRDRGTDGNSTNAISTITTKTTGGYAISDFVPLSMGAASTTYRELESGSVLSFVKAHSNGGKATTAMTVEVRYIEY